VKEEIPDSRVAEYWQGFLQNIGQIFGAEAKSDEREAQATVTREVLSIFNLFSLNTKQLDADTWFISLFPPFFFSSSLQERITKNESHSYC